MIKTIILLSSLFINNDICKKMGHVEGEPSAITMLDCPSYIQVVDSIEYLVQPPCNYVTFTCKRCGEEITERQKGHKEAIGSIKKSR